MSSLQIGATPKPLAAILPPDVLYIIARLTYPETFIVPRPGSTGSFIYLTRVCRHWRYTFLSYPLLWSKIHVPQRSIRYLKDILTRSADCPLHVVINFDRLPKAMTIQLNVIFAHLHRIKSLVFTQQAYTYKEPILNYIFEFPHINKPAPILEILHFDIITCISNGWHHPNVRVNPAGHIPEALFADHTPILKEFHVSSMSLLSHASIFKTITRLSLKHVHGLTLPCHLLDILEATFLHLQSLELAFPINYSWESSEEDFTRPTISLPSLGTLILNVGLQVLIVILNHTDIPPDVSWTIDCGNIISFTRDLIPLTTFMERLQKGVHINFTIDELDINIKYRNSLSTPYKNTFKIQASTTYIGRVRDVLINIGLSNIHSCELICLRNRLFPAWITTYERMYQGFFLLFDQISKLSIACENSQQLREFTYRLEPQKTVDGTDTIVPCPLLSDLQVGLVATTGRFLVQLLTTRMEAGHALTTIHVDYDNRVETINLKTELMELVENVEMVGKDILVTTELTDFVRPYPYQRISYTRDQDSSVYHR